MAESSQVEDTVGKGEISHYKQFLLFQQCFQKTFTANTEKPGLVWKGLKYRKYCKDKKSVFADGLSKHKSLAEK